MLRLTVLICGCAALAGAASITGVYNAGSWLPTALPNSGVARGAIFTVTGAGLGPATLQQVQSYPLPTTQGLAGTTVQVTLGSVKESCIMVYTVASQVAAILPSATPLGNGTLTVSYQGATASIPIQIVVGDFGMFTLNEGGSGPAVVTDLSYNPITMVNPAHPGDSLILWGTGLGAVSGDETQPPATVNFPGVQVVIENQPVVPSYAGRSSSPGLDQINVTVPAGITGGCRTSIVVVVNGMTGNAVTTAIAPAGQSTCGDTYGALTVSNMQKAVASGSLNMASVNLLRVGSEGDDTLEANFASFPVSSLIRSYGGSLGASLGSCIAYEVTGGSSFTVTDPIYNLGGLAPAPLDAGPSLVVSPQGGKAVSVNASATGAYSATLGSGGSDFIAPGVYTLSNGNGGSQVPAFSWSDTLPGPISFVGLASTIDRSKDLTVTWTNSSAFSLVSIFAYSGVPLTTTTGSFVDILCTAPATSTSFTIPSAILSLLPTDGYATAGVQGVTFEIAGVVTNRFTLSGTPGLDAGVFSTYTSSGQFVKVQ